MGIAAAIGHLPGKINMYDPETRMFLAGQRSYLLQPGEPTYGRLSPIATSSASQPTTSATASVMSRRHTLRGGTKAPISQPNDRLSPNPPTPLTHEGELSWTESVSVTCQHGARELSHLNLRGGIRLRSYECRVANLPRTEDSQSDDLSHN